MVDNGNGTTISDKAHSSGRRMANDKKWQRERRTARALGSRPDHSHLGATKVKNVPYRRRSGVTNVAAQRVPIPSRQIQNDFELVLNNHIQS